MILTNDSPSRMWDGNRGSMENYTCSLSSFRLLSSSRVSSYSDWIASLLLRTA